MEYFEFYDRDPDFQDIRKAFLSAVEEFHRERDFTDQFLSIAKELQISVKTQAGGLDEEEGKAFTVNDQRIILLKKSSSWRRRKFTEWHELSHHLFEILRGGEFKAFLDDLIYGNPDWRNSCEEELCFESAALLLMPNHVVDNVIDSVGFSPVSIFKLSQVTEASYSAATRRIVRRRGIDSHCILISVDGYVMDSFQYGDRRGKYSIGSGFRLEKSNPLLSRPFSPLEIEKFTAPVPFKRGNRNWMSQCMAAIDEEEARVIAFFLDAYPNENKDQLSLF